MIRIFVADDHNLVREGIVSLLSREHQVKVIGEACNGKETIEKVEKLRPDILIIDISMPDKNGIEVTEQLYKDGFTGKVIILTQHEKEEYVRVAMHAGASGYLVKDSVSKDLIDAVRVVSSGQIYFSPSISRFLLSEYAQRAKQKSPPRSDFELTARELEILQLIAEGCSSKQIADQLSVSIRTVDFHRANIIQKLGVRDVAGLTRYAIKHGIVKI